MVEHQARVAPARAAALALRKSLGDNSKPTHRTNSKPWELKERPWETLAERHGPAVRARPRRC